MGATFKVNLSELKEYERKFYSELEGAVKDSVEDFVQYLSDETPIGDSVKDRSWYSFRQKWYSELSPPLTLLPVEGLSSSNWRVSVSTPTTAFLQQYSTSPEQAGAQAYNSLSSYTLGKTIYINNNVPYVWTDGDEIGIGRSDKTIDKSSAIDFFYASLDIRLRQMNLT